MSCDQLVIESRSLILALGFVNPQFVDDLQQFIILTWYVSLSK